MADDPLWHRMQASSAVDRLVIWAMHEDDFVTPDDVLLHIRNVMRHDWPELEHDLIRRLTPGTP